MGTDELCTIGFMCVMFGCLLGIAYEWLGIDKILDEKIENYIMSLVNNKEDLDH